MLYQVGCGNSGGEIRYQATPCTWKTSAVMSDPESDDDFDNKIHSSSQLHLLADSKTKKQNSSKAALVKPGIWLLMPTS
jgi:hypothetical protein